MATPKGYTSVGLVAEEMGDAFDDSATLVDQCNTLIAEAEAFIDRATARAWAVVSPVVDELHTVTGPYLYLKHRPVSAISTFKVRIGAVGAPDVTLTAGSQYELIDGANGIVLINAAYPFGYDVVVNTTEYAGYIAKVTYVSTTPVPGDIERAATVLVAQWLQGRLTSEARGLSSYEVGSSGDTFKVSFSSKTVPDEVTSILKMHRAVLLA